MKTENLIISFLRRAVKESSLSVYAHSFIFSLFMFDPCTSRTSKLCSCTFLSEFVFAHLN